MIAPFNRQGVKPEDWPIPYRPETFPKNEEDIKALAYVCDCCRTFVGAITPRAIPGFRPLSPYWEPGYNPRLVTIGSFTYYGCSVECARILFDIHHRYALAIIEVKRP